MVASAALAATPVPVLMSMLVVPAVAALHPIEAARAPA